MRAAYALLVSLLALPAFFTPADSVAAESAASITGESVTFKSGELTLAGVLYKPPGAGPFPVVVWNHGSERRPGPQYDTVAGIFVPAGYVVFGPVRRGHRPSEGRYIVSAMEEAYAERGIDAANRVAVELLETEQLDDQLAGLAYVKALPFVDAKRIAVAGCSYGGIQSLLGAERDVGYRAALSISPAGLSWDGNPQLRMRLIQAVTHLSAPVLLLQPPKDPSLEPSRVLGEQAKRARQPLTTKVYPAVGPEEEQSHCFGGPAGMHVWAADAKAFFEVNLR
jgi:carboxymethylenebutenolidase